MNRFCIALCLVGGCIPGRPTTEPAGEGEGEGDPRPISFIVADAMSSFLNIEQPAMHERFLDNEDSINANTSASGEFRSGIHITLSLDNLRRSVDDLTTGAAGAATAAAEGEPIDRQPLLEKLAAVRVTDERFFDSYYADVSWVDEGPRIEVQRQARNIIIESYERAATQLP